MTNSTNAPHFLTHQFFLPASPWRSAEPVKTLLLSQHARALITRRPGGLVNLESAWNDERNQLTFPPSPPASDPDVRTDPYTYEQERTGRTNRMSVADLTCLARPFACRQKRYREAEYTPKSLGGGGGYVEKVKKQMREEGLASDGVPEGASPLPCLRRCGCDNWHSARRVARRDAGGGACTEGGH